MGKIRKIGKNWYVDMRDDSGHRIRKVVGPDKKDAQNALAAFQVDILRGEYRFKKERNIKFSKFAKEYLEYKKTQRLRAIRRVEASLKNLTPFFKEMPLPKITFRHINKYKEKRLEEVNPSTINRELACLKNMFTYAIKSEYVEKNPVKEIEFFQETKYEMRILNKEEIDRLIAASKGILRAIVTIALTTGARKNEILKLRWDDINFDKHFIFFKDTKSNIPRKVPMSGLVIQTLRGIEREGEFVFYNTATKDRIKDIKKGFKSACNRARIYDCRFHDLRHCAGTLMVESGIDLPTVAGILGHADIRTTLRYCHPTPENKRKAVEALAAVIGEKTDEEKIKDTDRINLPHSITNN